MRYLSQQVHYAYYEFFRIPKEKIAIADRYIYIICASMHNDLDSFYNFHVSFYFYSDYQLFKRTLCNKILCICILRNLFVITYLFSTGIRNMKIYYKRVSSQGLNCETCVQFISYSNPNSFGKSCNSPLVILVYSRIKTDNSVCSSPLLALIPVLLFL